MKIEQVRSDKIYLKIAHAPLEKKNDIYRYELMQPFQKQFDLYGIPIKAAKEGGYDVIMANEMMGFLSPKKIDESQLNHIAAISKESFWVDCQEALQGAADCFLKEGVLLPVQDYLYSVLLANPESIYTKLSDGYCGNGGIPGYIFVALVPNERTISKIPAALAHEFNHNVRFQFQKWNQAITLEDMMIAEGLAENFVRILYGEAAIGPWVTKTDEETLENVVKPIIKQGLKNTGFDAITAYLYGDEIAKQQNYFPVGLPYCAGYACGYEMVKLFLQKTKMSITQATLLPTKEITRQIKEFWQ